MSIRGETDRPFGSFAVNVNLFRGTGNHAISGFESPV